MDKRYDGTYRITLEKMGFLNVRLGSMEINIDEGKMQMPDLPKKTTLHQRALITTLVSVFNAADNLENIQLPAVPAGSVETRINDAPKV